MCLCVSLSDSVLVGEDQSVLLSVSAENNGEGAYETELVVRIPEHTHFQSSQVTHEYTHTHTHTHTVNVTHTKVHGSYSVFFVVCRV